MSRRGFTLIELLVVVAIIGILASIVLASLSSGRASAKDAQRIASLKSIAQALELYHLANGVYPPSTGGSYNFRSECWSWGHFAASQVIPGLVPTFMSVFPSDPDMNAGSSLCCLAYTSDGADEYKIADLNCQANADYASAPTFFDPKRDGNNATCGGGDSVLRSWAIYTPGFMCN
jgi:prepilin-type N-terminal cleavage/methylation domain-containing protein